MVGLINKEDIYNIADAIREKLQIEDTFKPSEMAELILSIGGGGGNYSIVNHNITEDMWSVYYPNSFIESCIVNITPINIDISEVIG